MSDDKDLKNYGNEDNEHTKDGNYFSNNENKSGGYSENSDSFSNVNSNYSSHEECSCSDEHEHYEKTDDSFFFENQEEEENELVDFTQRNSAGYAGFCQKIFSVLNGFIEKFNKKGGFIILFLLFCLFTYITLVLKAKLDPDQASSVAKIGVNYNLFSVLTAIISMFFYFLVCRIMFHFTKKDMKPALNPIERDARLGVYVAAESLLGVLTMALPTTFIPAILNLIIGVVLYSSVFYDRIEDERLLAVGIKSAIISIVSGIVFGLIVAAIIIGVSIATLVH